MKHESEAMFNKFKTDVSSIIGMQQEKLNKKTEQIKQLKIAAELLQDKIDQLKGDSSA